MLSDKVKELIKKSRIVSLEWQDYPESVVAIFQQADDEGQYLTDEDIAAIQNKQPELTTGLEQTRILRDNANEIIANARAVVLDANPGITEPGGGLYPPMRAEACWRDFWHFLRCVSYGVGGQRQDYLSDRGLGYMEQLYQELQVPLGAMVLGLEQLKVFSLRHFAAEQQESLVPYFDRLIESMRQFSAVR
ncbi:MAG: phycobilisome protein [Cyanobacteria bacterium J06623_7]